MAGNDSGAAGVVAHGDRRAFVARQALNIFGANLAGLAVGYVGSVLLARFLGPSSRGLLATMQTAAALAVTVLAVGTPQAANFLGSRRAANRPPLLGNGFVQTGVLTALALAAGIVLAGPLTHAVSPDYDSRLWLGAALLVPLTFLDFYVSNLLFARLALGTLNAIAILARLATVVTTVLFVGLLPWGVAGGLISVAAASLVMIVVGLSVLLPDGVAFDRTLVGPTLRYGARVSIGGLLNAVNGRFDLLVLAKLAPLSTVGLYAISQIVAELIMLVPRSLGKVLMPTVAAGGAEDRLSAPTIRLNGSLTLVAILGATILGPGLIHFGYGSDFNGAIVPFLLLLPGIWFLSAGGLIGDALRGRGYPGTVSALAAVEVVVTIALDLLLIPPFGAVGGAIASSFAYATFGVGSIVVLARQDGVSPLSLVVTTPAETSLAVRQLAGRLRR